MVPNKLPPSEICSGNTLEEAFELQETTKDLLARKNNLRFDELIAIAKRVGFNLSQDRTSHVIGRHPTHTLGPLYYDKVNFQEKQGKAKPYQVEQFVEFVREAQPKRKDNE